MIYIAHRSGPGFFPEQTIASAKRALANGADAAEMDVRETCDGALVICHDPGTMRMFGVDANVSDITLRDFLAMRHVSDRSYAPHTLDDVLACGVKPLLLHLKVGGGEVLTKLCELINRYGAQETTTFGIERVDDVNWLRPGCPKAKMLAFMPSADMLDDFVKLDIDHIRLWEQWVTQDRIDAIHAGGKKCWIMTRNDDCGGTGYTTGEALRRFIAMGADGLLVNDIETTLKETGGYR